jgi:hypothetical protein
MKDFKKSPRRIDLAMASIMAFDRAQGAGRQYAQILVTLGRSPPGCRSSAAADEYRPRDPVPERAICGPGRGSARFDGAADSRPTGRGRT